MNPDKSVLLIEAGGKDNYHWIHIPVGYLYCIGNQRTDWMYQTEPDVGLNGRGGVIKGLRLVDASVMPTITSGNTNSPTLMIAEKVAQWIAQEDWG